MGESVDLSQGVPIDALDRAKRQKRFSATLFAGIIIFVLTGIFGTYFALSNVYNLRTVTSTESSDTKPSVVVAQAAEEQPQHTPFQKEVIGFLPSWMVAQKAEVDPSRLTQLIYFGLSVNVDGSIVKYDENNQPVLEWLYLNTEYFKDLMTRTKHSGTKLLIAIKSFENKSIDNLISNQTSTNRFIKQLKDLIRVYDLDGVNFDFEYFTDSNFPTKTYLNSFLQTVSIELKKENPALIISTDVNASVVINDTAYDMVKIGEVVDQVILMGYDYSLPQSSYASAVSPLYGSDSTHSVSRSIKSLIGRVPLEKIILAVPFYGYEWETFYTSYNSPTVKNTGALATYKRVQELLSNRDDVTKHWNEKTASSYLIYKQSGAIKQIHYEDEQSLGEKLNFADNENIAGVAIWALGYEGNYKELWNVIEIYKSKISN